MLFALWGFGLFLDWVCCIGRKFLVRGKRNPPMGTNHKQTVWCQWVGSTILAKSRLKFWVMWLGYVVKQEFWSFWEKLETKLWVIDFEFELWVMSIELWKLSHGQTKQALIFQLQTCKLECFCQAYLFFVFCLMFWIIIVIFFSNNLTLTFLQKISVKYL